jgi:peptide/nickel transport system substrate-binding protein
MARNDQGNQAESGGITRRDVLKGAGAFVITAGLVSGMPNMAVAATKKPAKAKKGGKLRVGVVGSTNDIIDGQKIVAKADQARLVAGFETLLAFDENFKATNTYGLAQSVETKSLTQYVIKLRKGIKFHNKTPFNAASVIYSMQRLVDEKVGLPSYKALKDFIDPSPAGLRRIDDLTVEVNLKQPLVGFDATLAGYTNAMVPVGYTGGGSGTGPYILKSFTPGRESTHVKNPNYWRKGKPIFDEVTIIDFADKPALVNALRSGQIDAAVDIALSDIEPLKTTPGITVNEVSGGAWLTIVMMADKAPFDNPKVRQAMRLLIDRKQILDRALQGHGKIANDLFGFIDETFNANKPPQRTQDVAKAVALLKEAGYSKDKPLEVELAAPDDTGGLIPMAQAFAEQAKATDGIVKITAKAMDSTYWDTVYTKVPMYTSYWSPRAYLAQIAATKGFGETNYEKVNPAYADLYTKATAEPDPAKRLEIIKQLQKFDYEDGCYIIPVFNAFADAFSSKLVGVVERPSQLNLDYYGRGFQDLSFS